jgi:alginate O-acetyltransferase complex protein AlgI
MEMSFTSLQYIFFLGACLALLWKIRRPPAQRWLLIIFSYVFYLSFGVAGVAVVTFTLLADFYVGQRLGSSRDETARKRWLWIGMAANLAPLILFKYAAFAAGTAEELLRPFHARLSFLGNNLFGVIGLSYFTFSGMSYILDIFYENIEATNSLSEFASYLLYFPKLVAGPIVRAAEMLPSLRSGLRPSAADFETGCAYLLVGAVKKLVIADQLSSHVGMILGAPQQYNAVTLVQGMIGYTVQIYADFSGYSDMAIGAARLMGIEFPQNFQMPYSSVNIAEFWRRWHMTMSSWFRDYLFLPMEMASRGVRNVNVRIARNMMITMLLCGLWHGASWNFVLWGGLHGVALATYLIYVRNRPRQVRPRTGWALHLANAGARSLTLLVVMMGWIFFGTPNIATAFNYLWRMCTWASDGVSLGSPYILPLTALVILVHLFINKDRNVVEELSGFAIPVRVVTYSCLLIGLTTLVPSEAVPFVYVHF